MLTSAPITMLRSIAVPTATCPVLTPTRTLTGIDSPRRGPSRSARSTISRPARTPRSASSSWSNGTPNTPSTASPMKPSARPPSAVISSVTMPWNAASTSRKRSGSSRAASSVEPARSTNTTVTTRRSDAGATPTGAPQFGQKLAPGGSGSPQRGQGSVTHPWYSMICTGLPSGSRKVANRANPSTSPTNSSNAAPRCSRSQRRPVQILDPERPPVAPAEAGAFVGPVQRQPDRSRLELGPLVPVATDERQPEHVAVEGHGGVHVAGPVVDVVDGADHAPMVAGVRPPVTRRSALAEDPGLLRLELLFGEDATSPEVGETLELGGGRGRTRGGRTGVAWPLARSRVWSASLSW